MKRKIDAESVALCRCLLSTTALRSEYLLVQGPQYCLLIGPNRPQTTVDSDKSQ